MLKVSTGFCVFVLIGSTLSSIIDIFEATNGHEPRVAIKCGKVPFYIDLETGAWVSDSRGKACCDKNKEHVKRYCQKAYPKLNITNIVESNKPVKFNNWCQPGQEQCNIAKKVVPYRCLVNEYEADALMVPDGCKFDHLHDQNLCLTHDHWKKKAAKECNKKYSMKLKDYGILLSCKTDFFTGVEFVCCPKKHHKKPNKVPKEKGIHKVDKESFSAAIKNFQSHMPLQTKGCDRSNYLTKQTKMEDRHRNQIAAVVDEWDEAEKRYNKLKAKDPKAAEEKMKRTLEVFRTTLAALEDESKQEKGRLRAEHAECINTQIAKNKRDAMIAFLAAVEESPIDTEKILKAVRKFIQVCEHDRVHSLRHFEHVRNRDAKKAVTLRGELLQHLKDLNKIVNESMALLNYLPEISEKFGITGSVGGAILKPRLELPLEEHDHGSIEKIKNSHIYRNIAAKRVQLTVISSSMAPKETPDPVPTDDIPHKAKPSTKTFGTEVNVPETKEFEHDDDEDEMEDKESHDKRSPFAFNAIMGLACGVLVIMLFVVIAIFMRRRRLVRTRVVLAENNDDREHLVQMQKSGFENPTYKFFYY